ncbi:hypothetical protein D3C85_179300 [compost metagenome]
MRGNHRILFRQDYVEPAPLSSEDLARLSLCCVSPRHPERTKPLHHHVVQLDGVLLGYVATRCGGQVFKLSEAEEWIHAVSDWSRNDPPHAHAILKLLDAHGMLPMGSENKAA